MAETIRIAVLRETEEGEARVAATPETVGKFIKLGAEVAVEQGAGAGARLSDAAYEGAGAKVLTGPQALEGADIVLAVRAPDPVALAGAKPNAWVAAMHDPFQRGERTSVADTCAPSRLAVAIAWSPATPTPITNTLAGLTVPAAVIIIGNARPKLSAEWITAL
jgi:NAD/NADP transhydrogenase alpha subunit